MNQPNIEAMRAEINVILKYQEISGLIGRTLQVSSAETAPEEVLQQCQDLLPSSARFCSPGLEARQWSIAKRGILNLTYCIDPLELGSIQPGGAELAETLGLFQGLPSVLEPEGVWEAELWEDLKQGNAYARLLLRTWEQLTPQERERRRVEGVPKNFFIKTFRILDACLTNSDFVWINKHFPI